ncbi:MAG: hypothetical protein V7L00_00445 [Nostoc sp.]|uniref:hypothetical protein n=1 Tax=Nostoc sp. TaxID=1180 RepID=UPI002FFBA6D7
MAEIIEIPVELTHFQLPEAVQERLQFLLDRQDAGKVLTQGERREAEGLVELAEFLSLLHLLRRSPPSASQRVMQQG